MNRSKKVLPLNFRRREIPTKQKYITKIKCKYKGIRLLKSVTQNQFTPYYFENTK